MSLTAVPSRPLPRRAPTGPPAIPFPVPGGAVTRLRRLRDRFFREGRLDLALQAAIEVARRDPDRESYLKLGFLQREAGHYRKALKALRDALRFREGARYLVPEIYLHLAHTWFLLGNRKKMLRAHRRAYACRPKPRSDGKFNLVFGNDLFGRGRFREAAEEYARAEASFRKSEEKGGAAVNRGLALVRLGELEEARICMGRAIRVFKRGGHEAKLAEARSFVASIRFDQGQPRRALGILLRAAQAFRKCGKRDREAEAYANAGYAAGEIGLWPRSQALLNRAIRLSKATGDREALARAHACRATACAHLGDLERAADDLGHSRTFLRGRRYWVGTLHLCRAVARIAALRGDWAGVRRAARQAERVASRAGDAPRVEEFRRLRARAEAELGRPRASSCARASADRLAGIRGGPSAGRREAESQASRPAAAALPVLILGDGPTGRLDFAPRRHTHSRHSRGPLVVAPCEQFVFPAAEIGGHARGAWSGADGESPGLARRARGGTLVLDRVDELPAEAQRVLVPVVDRKVRRVGEAGEELLDARIVATCRDPGKLIPALRERLSAAVLRLPALQEDRGGLSKIVKQSLRGRREITLDALAELVRRPWDGDSAEVRAAVERLVAFSDGTIGRRLVRRVLTGPESCRPGPRVHKKRPSRQMASAMA